MFGLFKKKSPPPEPPKRFPPVPEWRPEVAQPLARIAERVRYYTDGKRDFVVFRNGTFVVVEDGLSDEQARAAAEGVLHRIFHAHPDMSPVAMDDGNMLVRYNEPAGNVVLSDLAEAHWPEIERRHLQALATSEVLHTELGPNRFDDFGKRALFGRCFLFMDAQDPEVRLIERKEPSRQ